MIRYTLKLFGFPILSVDAEEFEVEGEDAAQILGGASHDFERDATPLSPTDHLEWEWEDRKRFGFG